MTTNSFGDYLSISFVDSDHISSNSQEGLHQINRIWPFADSPVHYVSITKTRLLTKGEDVKTAYDITFDVQHIDHKFEPGDTIGILPCNDEDEVEQILTRLNLISMATKPYNLCILKNTSKKKPVIPAYIPTSGTVRELFTNNLDIHSLPKKMFLRSLVRYTTQQEEVEKLQLLSSFKGSQEYIKFVTNHRTLLSLLVAFPSCHPPIERLLENLPPLQPRPYSISSSPLQKILRITFAVINTVGDTRGVCSGWLEDTIKKFEMVPQKNLDDREIQRNAPSEYYVPFYFRKVNKFRLPADPTIPIIMIGPGTGVAPFIGFLRHRQLQTEEGDVKFGTSWLFYGCRYSDRDFLYKHEVEQFLQNGTLTKLFTCFSRENPKKIYVQDMIRKHGKNVIDKIVYENASIFICGDAKDMAIGVKNTILSCLEDFQGLSSADAVKFIENLERTNRYIQDVWL